MEHLQIAEAIEQLVEEKSRGGRVRSAIVTAVSSGLTEVRRAGSAASEGGYARLIPSVPKVGQRVALARLGGAELVLGVISRVAESLLDLGAPVVGQSYATARSQGSADTGSTTSVSPVFADAVSLSWGSLPDGTYDVVLTFSLLVAHSGGGSVAFRGVFGGSNGSAHTFNVESGTVGSLRVEVSSVFSDVVVAGGVTVRGQYAVGSGGTAYGRNPSLTVSAVRKA